MTKDQRDGVMGQWVLSGDRIEWIEDKTEPVHYGSVSLKFRNGSLAGIVRSERIQFKKMVPCQGLTVRV